MTKQTIIKKAIEKAVKNGFNERKHNKILEKRSGLGWEVDLCPVAYEYLIFSHNFAKAFWGYESKQVCINEDHNESGFSENSVHGTRILSWQYHLQQMVLEEKPLKYIEKFL